MIFCCLQSQIGGDTKVFTDACTFNRFEKLDSVLIDDAVSGSVMVDVDGGIQKAFLKNKVLLSSDSSVGIELYLLRSL